MTAAILHMDGFAGLRDYPVTVLKETDKRYRVKLLMGSFRQGHRTRRTGDVFLAPKHAVSIKPDRPLKIVYLDQPQKEGTNP